MILLDTSILIDSFCGPRASEAPLRKLVSSGEKVRVPAIVIYEWLRGPRIEQELIDQEAVLPRHLAIPFEHTDAAIAAEIYRSVRSPRTREIDITMLPRRSAAMHHSGP